jgi:hypothetical protein
MRFQDYLDYMVLRIPQKERSKEAMIQTLEEMIASLESFSETDARM